MDADPLESERLEEEVLQEQLPGAMMGQCLLRLIQSMDCVMCGDLSGTRPPSPP